MAHLARNRFGYREVVMESNDRYLLGNALGQDGVRALKAAIVAKPVFVRKPIFVRPVKPAFVRPVGDTFVKAIVTSSAFTDEERAIAEFERVCAPVIHQRNGRKEPSPIRLDDTTPFKGL